MTYLERMHPKQGLRVLVTAGASGIGAAIASAFLEAGARVAICDVDDAALRAFEAANPSVYAIRADVSDPEAIDRLFAMISDDLGGLDVLVNNAGIAGPTGLIEDMPVEEVRRTIDIDLVGQLLVTRRAAPHLKRSEDASIINISSVAGRFGYAMRTPYSAAKWGIVGLTASLAKEMGPDGVRVNAILPGVVRGARMDKVIEARAGASGRTVAEMEDEYVSSISLRRMVEPDDVALTALFLSSPAGANISGQAISVCAQRRVSLGRKALRDVCHASARSHTTRPGTLTRTAARNRWRERFRSSTGTWPILLLLMRLVLMVPIFFPIAMNAGCDPV